MALGVLVGSAGGVKVGAGGGVQATDTQGVCAECGCGGEPAGPCCLTQTCSFVPNAAGGWTFTMETSLVGTIDVASAPWYGNFPPGDSPAFSVAHNIRSAKQETRSGAAHCGAEQTHSYIIFNGFFGYGVTDSQGVVTTRSLTPSVPYRDPNVSPNAGCGDSSCGLLATLALTQAVVSSRGTLISGTPKASGNKIRLEFSCTQEEYQQNDSLRNYQGRQPGWLRICAEIYDDGTYAIWDGGFDVRVSDSFSVSVEKPDGCVTGVSIGYTCVRRYSGDAANPNTTFTGVAAARWAAGVIGCVQAPAANAEDCAKLNIDHANMPFGPPAVMPAWMADEILDEALSF